MQRSQCVEFHVQPGHGLLTHLCCLRLQEPGIARTDLQQNVRLLSKLSTPLHAVTCLLASHEQTMEHQLQLLRTNVAADSNDFELLGAISQRVFGVWPHHLLRILYACHCLLSMYA